MFLFVPRYKIFFGQFAQTRTALQEKESGSQASENWSHLKQKLEVTSCRLGVEIGERQNSLKKVKSDHRSRCFHKEEN